MTEFMDLQTNLLLMRRRVALTPGWAMLWSVSKTCLWSCCGTRGLKLPVEESPKSTLLPTSTEVRVMDGNERMSCTCGQVAWSSAISDIEEGGGMGWTAAMSGGGDGKTCCGGGGRLRASATTFSGPGT